MVHRSMLPAILPTVTNVVGCLKNDQNLRPSSNNNLLSQVVCLRFDEVLHCRKDIPVFVTLNLSIDIYCWTKGRHQRSKMVGHARFATDDFGVP
jgi:hypothetical protein